MKRFTLALCLLLPLTLAAQEETEEASGWSGEGTLGFTSSSGNTDSENLNAGLQIAHEVMRWKHSLSLEIVQSEADGEESADRWSAKERSQYALDEKSYSFFQARYEEDEFSGYEHQGSLTVGLGSRLIKNDRHLLDLSAGIGYRSIKDSETGETEDGGILTSDLFYEYKLSETSRITEQALVEAGEDNTYIESETALITRINGRLASKISYQVKHNSDVPDDTEKTDKLVTVSLVYSF